MVQPVILIVDDAVENIRILKALLADLGQIVFSLDGGGALDQAARHHPDLILLDVVMPGIDGLETCRRLKAGAETKDTPIIFISGADGKGDEAQGLAAGAVDYIAKPFTPEIVRARVHTQLELVRTKAELRELRAVKSSV